MTCEVKIIEDSTCSGPSGSRLVTIQLKYWRAIHAELMTHRDFSRNASSSRAIPVKTMLKQVWNDPAGPIHWGANQAGMQANEQLTGWRNRAARFLWRTAGRTACVFAWGMMKVGLHKQVANRLLEPWQYIHVVVTSSKWNNFFALRCHPDAQPEIQELAMKMRAAMDAATPRELKGDEWHLPYVSDEERATCPDYQRWLSNQDNPEGQYYPLLAKVSAARCCRVSYLTHDGKTPDQKADLDLFERLVGAAPIHASPTEHQAQPDGDGDLRSHWGNLSGWAQLRKFVESEVC